MQGIENETTGEEKDKNRWKQSDEVGSKRTEKKRKQEEEKKKKKEAKRRIENKADKMKNQANVRKWMKRKEWQEELKERRRVGG